jgi:riboflavin synthase
MFTGIVKGQGLLLEVERENSSMKLKIQSDLDASFFTKGNSISVDGACLTVETYEDSSFTVHLVEETLNKTISNAYEVGEIVNIEPAMTLQTPLAGHMVSGHVDGKMEVLSCGEPFVFKFDPSFLKYMPVKGSVTLNGVSLTIAEIENDKLSVWLIPETLKETNLSELKVGSLVNFEVDLLARYMDQLMNFGGKA